ncbi:tyrosyl-DNA phosphodiesterase 2 [Galendromus occidentalis]|uniref:Tyrosyl-DNA phosphodiesterase 2 n=1 Tax=Galendromus occidentalis TaxID=34638 RepID=A0AAJ6QZ24_9ACAR|nr:tyrosyl-DNA phosphodiesterase 2 [Galendromus occidentalis]
MNMSESEPDNGRGDRTSSDEENESGGLPENFPPVEVCLERCRKFVELTNTNEALAQFFLQDRDWDLERSVADYFQENEERNAPSSSSSAVKSEMPPKRASGDVVELSSDSDTEEESDDLLKIVSWNIDGLDQKNRDLRTKNVCATVKKAAADIVMLQEVVPETLRLIDETLSKEYHLVHSGVAEYFTAMLFHRKRVSFVQDKVFEFSNSVMGRKLQAAEVSFKNAHKLFILNTHLESTGEFSDARRVQLQKCFRNLNKISDGYSAVLAGDLNLRDKELDGIGGIPAGICDMWERLGSRPEAKYTWDMTRNDNLLWNARFKPRCRFDRMYFKESLAQPRALKPVYFGLIGLERILPHRCFPSDHWGLYAHFKLQ